MVSSGVDVSVLATSGGLLRQLLPGLEVELLAAVGVILALGIASRVLADRLQIPSVLFLIIAGVIIGPEGLGIVLPEHFGVTDESVGAGLTTMVGVAVSIILFEGAFQLHRDRLREAPKDIARLVTVGAVLMWLGTATTVQFFIPEAGWVLGLLVGALLIATGPTVITPLLNVVTVRDHVASTLESEGVINDVSAAILAVVIFEVLILHGGGPGAAVLDFILRVGTGTVVGLLAAGAVWLLLTRANLSPEHGPLHARLITLAFIVFAFGIANSILGEAGIAAAAAMGIALGNVEIPYEEEIEHFAEDLTTIVLSFVFVALAALISFDDILALGAAGFLVVAAVTLLVRPLLVFVSIWHERFTFNEKAFMSLVAPRGIIPASVATLFALELQHGGELSIAAPPEVASQILAGTVFLVIFATVVFQGGLARQIAEYLNVIPMRTIIVGAGRTGQALAKRLEQDGENVVLVDPDEKAVQRAREAGFRVVRGDGTDDDTLREAGIKSAESVIAATGDDDVNLLVGQQARTKYDVPTVAARVNEPDNVDSFQDVGIRAIDSALATAYSIENVLERPSLSSWMNELGRTGDVREIEVTASDLVNHTIEDVNKAIPRGTIVGLIHEANGSTHTPNADYQLKQGDSITFIGEKKAVEKAVKRFHPRD